ncbi:MAG TPA: DUF86 domain-containing protein [Candidatus Latescibacteria bacterium]|nr:DUF86 domain-containing protein [Candidatus Handelsmanbacteria bacterium]HIL09435.1 DUF86 domain-containing protein [Candidatus Latescibacterota bacterium]
MRDDGERLRDILEAIERVGRYAAGGTAALENNELVQTWILHHLQIIGEASNRLSQALRADHPEVEWSQIIGMRNILVHHYFEIDLDIVKAVLEKDLPPLKIRVQAILSDMDETAETDQ